MQIRSYSYFCSSRHPPSTPAASSTYLLNQIFTPLPLWSLHCTFSQLFELISLSKALKSMCCTQSPYPNIHQFLSITTTLLEFSQTWTFFRMKPDLGQNSAVTTMTTTQVGPPKPWLHQVDSLLLTILYHDLNIDQSHSWSHEYIVELFFYLNVIWIATEKSLRTWSILTRISFCLLWCFGAGTGEGLLFWWNQHYQLLKYHAFV